FLDRNRTIVSASCDDTVRFWNIHSAAETQRLSGSMSYWEGHTFAYARGKATMAAAGGDGAIKMRDAGSGKEIIRWAKTQSMIASLAYSGDGNFLARGGDDGFIRVREADTGRERYRFGDGQGGPIVWVGISPDGKSIAGSCNGDRSFRIWRLGDGQEIRRISA